MDPRLNFPSGLNDDKLDSLGGGYPIEHRAKESCPALCILSDHIWLYPFWGLGILGRGLASLYPSPKHFCTDSLGEKFVRKRQEGGFSLMPRVKDTKEGPCSKETCLPGFDGPNGKRKFQVTPNCNLVNRKVSGYRSISLSSAYSRPPMGEGVSVLILEGC